MTQPTQKPAFGSPKERGVNEEELQKVIPPTKEVGGVQHIVLDTDE